MTAMAHGPLRKGEEDMGLKDAAMRAGVAYRTAARWCETGVIRPRGYHPKGWPGRKPIPWTEKETRELENIAALREAGMSLQALKRAGRFLRKALQANPYSEGRFMVLEGPRGKKELVRILDGEAVALLEHPGQIVLVPLFEGSGDEVGELKERAPVGGQCACSA